MEQANEPDLIDTDLRDLDDLMGARHESDVLRRQRRKRARAGGGFTLIELIVSIAIVGILAGLAQASFSSYVMRTRRSKATVGLGSIHLAQTAHFVEFSAYGDTFDEIGYPLESGERLDGQSFRAKTYTFTVRALPLDGQPSGNFQAVATGDLDSGGGVLDILMIENQLTVLP